MTSYLYAPLSLKDRQPLRNAVYRAFADLPLGEFFVVEEFLDRYSTGRDPLLSGENAKSVIIQQDNRRVPPLEEFLEEAARRLR